MHASPLPGTQCRRAGSPKAGQDKTDSRAIGLGGADERRNAVRHPSQAPSASIAERRAGSVRNTQARKAIPEGDPGGLRNKSRNFLPASHHWFKISGSSTRTRNTVLEPRSWRYRQLSPTPCPAGVVILTGNVNALTRRERRSRCVRFHSICPLPRAGHLPSCAAPRKVCNSLG